MKLKIGKLSPKAFITVAGCYIMVIMAGILGSNISKYIMYGIVIGVAVFESFVESRTLKIHKQCPFICIEHLYISL